MLEETPIEFTHSLICASCHHRFSIISKEKENTKLDLPKKFCPECGKKKVQLDPSQFPSFKPSLESQGRLNREASHWALKQASEQKRIDAEMGEGKEITINPPLEENKSSFRISEKVIKSIQEKVGPEVQKLLEE